MKNLVLVRHAKSSWKAYGMNDFERPLNDRGKREAPLMGKVLRQRQVIPALYLTSPAMRAVSTAQAILREMGLGTEVLKTDQALYLADVETILEVLAKDGGTADTIFVTGHNPGLTELANSISGARIDSLPTCGIFAVAFVIEEWTEIAGSQGQFQFFDYPKNHH